MDVCAFHVPVLWGAVGTSAAVQLGMREDFGLLIAAIAGTWLGLHAATGSRIERTNAGA